MISADDAEYPREYHTMGGGGGGGGGGAGGSGRRFSSSGLIHTSSARSLEALTNLQKAEMDALAKLHKADIERQRDAHYKSRQQASATATATTLVNTNSARQQQQPNYWSFKARTPRHSQPSPVSLADQAGRVSFASAESLETMSESDVPLGFSRMNRLRQSLPLARSPSQTKLRAPGVLFLQLGDEVRRVHITHELTSLETLHALLVHMFPQKLTMGALRAPSTAILVKDEARNVFYELEDPRDVHDRCVIKVYCREAALQSHGVGGGHAGGHGGGGGGGHSGGGGGGGHVREQHYATLPHTPQHLHHHAQHVANGDLRRELVYSSRDSSPTRRLNQLPSSSSPSGSPSRSSHARLSYAGGRPSSYAGPSHASPQQQQQQQHSGYPHGHPHHPAHHSAGHTPQQTPSHGHGHGQSHPSHGGFGPSPSAILERRDVKPDEEPSSAGSKSVVLLRGGAGGDSIYADPYSLVPESRLSVASPQALAALRDPLLRRGSVRSLTSYSAAALQSELEGALYRPGGPGTAAHAAAAAAAALYADPYATMGFRRLPPASPQKIPDGRDPYASQPGRGSPGRQVFRQDGAVFMDSPKSRASSAGPDQLCVLGGEQTGLPGYSSPLPGNETETRDRMEAMEKQIASLTGLVQSVLTRGPDSPEKGETASDCSATEPPTPSAPLALMPPPPTGASQPITVTRLQMQQHLSGLQHSTTELRKQLDQLRKLQLQNQDSVQALLKQTESELGLCMLDAQRTQEDPLQRQRLLVEEERLRYLNEEELIIQQLHDLERSVEEMRTGAGLNHKLVTEQEVEQKSLELRRLGETLTDLKNQFPSLQSKMRVVLRVEVEAVKFLKEEPLRLDALLKRCRTITDSLTLLRRQVTEGHWRSPEDFSSQPSKPGEPDFAKTPDALDILNSPGLGLQDIAGSLGASLGGGGSALANWMPSMGTGVADGTVPELDGPAAGAPKRSSLEDMPGSSGASRRDSDKVSAVEVRLAAERDWEEKRASLTQFSTQDINRLLEETQAELMKAIPDLDFAAKQISKPAVPPKPQLSSLPGPLGGASNNPSPSHTPEHQPSKTPTPSNKLSGKDSASRRGSGELTVPRYRTEKPSKSPPPPPPRRSFPSAHGLTTTRSGDVIITTKTIKLENTEDCNESDNPPQTQTPPVKLRRPSTSDSTRPSSTPPTIAASGVKEDEDEDEKIMAELEVFQRAPVRVSERPSGPLKPSRSALGQRSTGSLGQKNASNPSGSKPMQSSAATRLKHLQQSSLERRSRKQREDFPKLQQGQQGQQQVFHF
ncbi:SRC kinase signaling inhibitor 1-like isoform X2 [Alosa sapidissima]|uniref:SRC kinase signaling inhibitor 1-like isoform X2 n=1 Tax=Alosa sapidissima TaxID=34773 RepID=UPI001C0857B5|nr:SRC kinase signaling inhibitor 1-like isoform X2 [Alosa sapidissima]